MTSGRLLAARDNAAWCGAMAASHGVRAAFFPDLWAASSRTPRSYPDAVTLAPGAAADAVLRQVDTASPGCSIKDSFADLDLAPLGFQVLLEGSWIICSGGWSRPSPPCQPIEDVAALVAWETAHSGGMTPSDPLFTPALLRNPDVHVVATYDGDDVLAGAVLSSHGPVVGLSNVFTGRAGDLSSHWGDCVTTAASLYPGLPVVGWETPDDLAPALDAGFERCGELLVWAAAP